MQLYDKEKPRGAMDVARDTIKTKGITGLYRGLTTLLYFSIPKSSARFWGYENAKSWLQDSQGGMSLSSSLLAGFFAGSVEAVLVVTPMETMKVKLIHDILSPTPQYKGFFHGVTTIAKAQGFSGCYKGLGPTILKQGSNQMIRFAVFNGLKARFVDDPRQKLQVYQTVSFGVLAGAVSVFANTPVDVIKTRMQGLEAHRYNNSLDCALQLMKNEGAKGFYKGTSARLVRVCLDVAIQMTIYEQIMYLFNTIWK